MKVKPKLQLRNRRPALTHSQFEQLVHEAVDVCRELSALEHPSPDLCRKPVSAEAFVRESLALAKSSRKRTDALRKAIDVDSPAAAGTLRRMQTFISGPNCKAPPTRKDRLRWLANDATVAELAALGNYSLADLFACAAQIVAEREPALFGDADSSVAVRERLVELQRRRAELFAKITHGWTAADILASARDPHPTFKLAPTVTIAPAENLAERLVNELVRQAE